MSKIKPRKIIIEAAMNGLVVRVGCSRVVFENTQDFINWLQEYFNNPEDTEKKFITKKQYWKDEECEIPRTIAPMNNTPYEEDRA